MKFEIRAATIADLPAMHALVRELAIYERAPESHTATVEDYEKDFRDRIFEAHVAVDSTKNEVVGMVWYHFAYSTWRGRMMYLEDFVVTESYRRFGLGQLLFDKFLEVAREKECKLVKWQVLDWNEPAIKFYEKNNALIETEWFNGKIIF
ncbi:MAG: hypothetical protein RL757_3225 [Bacteroidota bacterium]|jgi:GNAT superfamily N-acetyltransferase